MSANFYPQPTPSKSIGSNRLRARGAEARWLARLVTRQMLGQTPIDPVGDMSRPATTAGPLSGRHPR